MADAAPLVWAGALLSVTSVALLRFAWSLPRRSPAWNGAGWAAIAAAILLAAQGEGAWGAAMAALFAMTAAFVALAVAGVRSPPGRARALNRRAGMLSEPGEPRRVGRRAVTFLLVIAGGFAGALALALALHDLGGALGWSEGNANVLALYSVPLTWAVLAFALLMQTRRRDQLVTLLACAVPVLLTGVAS